MELKEALEEMDAWHHSVYDEKHVRETLTVLPLEPETVDSIIEECREAVKQGEDGLILKPVKASEESPANGFICQNADCPLPQGVWTKDWMYNVIPLDKVLYCPICGCSDTALVHAYEKGEEEEVINGNWVVGQLVRRLGLKTQGFMGRGYQHRENMRALRTHLGEGEEDGRSISAKD